jgi:hypothetical protein
VAIRITSVVEATKPVLQVDGWLRGEEAAELVRAVEANRTPVVLDLAELRSADRSSLEVLRGLCLQGVELRRVPPLIGAQLGKVIVSGSSRDTLKGRDANEGGE